MNQTFRDLVIAVYDNASGDDTPLVVSELMKRDGRIRYHCHDQNIGAPANFDFGLSNVRTPMFSLLADDDVMLPGFYAEAVTALAENGEAMFFCSRTVVDNRIAGVISDRAFTWRPGMHHPGEDVVCRMIANHFVSTSVVFRSGVQESVGRFASFHSDLSFMVAAAARHSFVVSDEVRAVFTIHESSFTSGTKAADGGGQDVDFMSAILSEVVRALAPTATPAAEGTRVLSALRSKIRRNMLWHVGFQALPVGRWSSLERMLHYASEIDLSPGWRIFLGSLRSLSAVPGLRIILPSLILITSRMLTIGRARLLPNRTRNHQIREYLEHGLTLPPSSHGFDSE